MNRTDDPTDIRNWQRRSGTLTTSGKLEPGDPARLAAIGVRHVINLALDDHPEALADEAALLAAQGIAYTHIPVPFDAPTAQHVRQLRKAMEDGERPVHVHCIMNYRVAAFLYLIEREDGVSEAEARGRMAEIWDPSNADHPAAAPWATLIA